MGRMRTETELTLEQTQQGVSYEVSMLGGSGEDGEGEGDEEEVATIVLVRKWMRVEVMILSELDEHKHRCKTNVENDGDDSCSSKSLCVL
ncbi:hypothetical protein Tco_0168265 [Tanacetum coccineum]